ncbi:unnamed protein product [Amoebophrya sp. A120]|nr:unnamed protein product [Amoebophrya sp. A120]|eukprot:GSA120T00011190001.1
MAAQMKGRPPKRPRGDSAVMISPSLYCSFSTCTASFNFFCWSSFLGLLACTNIARADVWIPLTEQDGRYFARTEFGTTTSSVEIQDEPRTSPQNHNKADDLQEQLQSRADSPVATSSSPQALLVSLNAPWSWIPGVECTSCEPMPPGFARKFNATASKTFQDAKIAFEDTMGHEFDSALGMLGRDFAQFSGGRTEKNHKVEHERRTSSSGSFMDNRHVLDSGVGHVGELSAAGNRVTGKSATVSQNGESGDNDEDDNTFRSTKKSAPLLPPVVTFSTTSTPPTTRVSFTFGVVKQTRRSGSPFFGNGFSGILGFAPNTTTNLLLELRKQGVISSPILALNFGGEGRVGSSELRTRTASTRTSALVPVLSSTFVDYKNPTLASATATTTSSPRSPPVMQLGGVDPTSFEEMYYFPVVPSKDTKTFDNWRLGSTGTFACNGKNFTSPASRDFGVLLTTSLDVIAVPDDELEEFVETHLKQFVVRTEKGIYLLKPGAELAVDICFKGEKNAEKCFLLRTEDLLQSTVLGDYQMLLLLPHSLMRPGFPLGQSGWILGTRFLKHLYSVFEYSTLIRNPRVGLAIPRV